MKAEFEIPSVIDLLLFTTSCFGAECKSRGAKSSNLNVSRVVSGTPNLASPRFRSSESYFCPVRYLTAQEYV